MRQNGFSPEWYIIIVTTTTERYKLSHPLKSRGECQSRLFWNFYFLGRICRRQGLTNLFETNKIESLATEAVFTATARDF